MTKVDFKKGEAPLTGAGQWRPDTIWKTGHVWKNEWAEKCGCSW